MRGERGEFLGVLFGVFLDFMKVFMIIDDIIKIRDVYAVIQFQFNNHIIEEMKSYPAYKLQNCKSFLKCDHS
jgi:hypothetical protein